jgi:hypothetical protein
VDVEGEIVVASAGRELSPDELGLLVWCAMDYDRRLPTGIVPPAVWEALTPEWRAKINTWKGSDRDAIGAQVRGMSS